MHRKNFIIMAVTVAVTLFLAAFMFVGLRFWFSPLGLGLAVTIVVVSCVVPFASRPPVSASSQNSPVESAAPALPGWVRIWQRVALWLFILAVVVLVFQYERP